MTTASPRLSAVTVYQWRLNHRSRFAYCCYIPDRFIPHMLPTLCADGVGGEARAFTFTDKSVAELRREGWVR